MAAKWLLKAGVVMLTTCNVLSLNAQSNITIDASKIENPISPYLYGSCIEDVNHEIYGGLYDQRIFGESFEEPRQSNAGLGFLTFEGEWSVGSGVMHVNSSAGAKSIYSPVAMKNGVAEVEIKFDQAGGNGDLADLLLRVSNPGNGADRFNGYEIGLSADGKKVLLGAHQNDWRPVAENATVNFNPITWNKLKVAINENTITIFLNDAQIISYTDTNVKAINVAGNIGLRTWNAGISYRNLKITPTGDATTNVALQNEIPGFSGYDGNWTLTNGTIHVNSFAGAKYVYDPLTMENGTAEVEVKFDNAGNSGNIANILLRVSNPDRGADSFNGYEIGITADGKKALIGAHRYNWRAVTDNNTLNFDPTQWNKLKVVLNGNLITVFLNDVKVIDFTDANANSITGSGNIALRTWNAGVSFRNLKITPSTAQTTEVPFTLNQGVYDISKTWDVVLSGSPVVNFTRVNDDSYNTSCSQEIEFVSGTGKAGIANRGLNKWGLSLKKDQHFQGSLYIKGLTSGKIKVALQNSDGSMEYAVQELSLANQEWTKYPIELTPDTEDNNARLAIYTDQPGKFRIDQVTLMAPQQDQFHGLPLRKDIGQAMADQRLTFLRYGGTMVNVPDYKFKNMIGDRDKRPQYRGNWYPYSTNGFGIEEFLQFCEAAGIEPAFAVNTGETAQDMADMIEYLNGPSTTVWGKKRADAGHPEPYGVKYIEIGNEEVIWGDIRADYQKYIQDFNKIHDAILAKDPSIVFISAAWWRLDSPVNMKMVFDALNGKAAYWDYHPWADDLQSGNLVATELLKMQNYFKQWDPTTEMKCVIFEENGNTHNLQRALAHATIQNTARRAGNFLLATCAANALEPYMQNDNGWNQGQIFFSPSQVWGMPPYYAQQMASQYHKPLRIQSVSPSSLDVVATTDNKKEEIVLYVVNTNNYAVNTTINVSGAGRIQNVKTSTLKGLLSDINTPANPVKIIPAESVLNGSNSFNYVFPAYSYTILVLENQTESTRTTDVNTGKYIDSTDTNQIKIKSCNKDQAVYEIVSSKGTAIARGLLNPDSEVVENCNAGIYVVSLSGRTGKEVRKVVVP